MSTEEESKALREAWIAGIFAQPPGSWYPEYDPVDIAHWRDRCSEEQLALMNWCFLNPDNAFEGLNDDQIAQGLILTVHHSFLDWASAMFDDDLRRRSESSVSAAWLCSSKSCSPNPGSWASGSKGSATCGGTGIQAGDPPRAVNHTATRSTKRASTR